MSRLANLFATLREKDRKALIPFVTAGDPHPGFTVPLMHEAVAAGADVLELGVPFSDPMADGPAIQLGNERALAHGVTLFHVLDMVREFRKQDPRTPVVLMGYLNPIEVIGYQRVADEARAAGVDGFIVVDMPPEEADGLQAILSARELDLVFLVAPTTSEDRVASICARASGFIYYVSLRGVTGAGHLDVDEVARKVAVVKRHTALPVGVGFGIRDGQSAARIAAVSDAVVIGSALVNRIEAGSRAGTGGENDVRTRADVVALIKEIRVALDDLPAQVIG